MSISFFEGSPTSTSQWTVDGAIVTYGKGTSVADFESDIVPLYMSSIQMTFQRRAQPMFPLNTSKSGTRKRLMINLPPEGTLQTVGLYGPSGDSLKTFFETFSSPCADGSRTLYLHPFSYTCEWTDTSSSSTGAQKAAKHGWKLYGVTLETVGMQINGQEPTLCNLPLTFRFTGLDYAEVS